MIGVKRIFDLGFACVALPFLVVPLVFISFIVWLDVGFPILFKQTRVGFDNKQFVMLKFRTMRNVVDKHGSLLADEARVTSIGRALRRTSIDEIPELWNVITGDMSLVGPRPLLPEYQEFYTKEQIRRHQVLPGITGWAQVNGRNSIDWDEKFTLDVWYVDHWSLVLDLKILLLTTKQVFKGADIDGKDGRSVKPFKG